MQFLRKNLLGVALVVLFAVLPLLSFAQPVDNGNTNTNCDPSQGQICNPIKVDSVNGFVKVLLTGLIH